MRSDAGEVGVNSFAGLSVAHCSQFRVGGVLVRVAGESRHDVALVPSLIPFRVETGVSDINIHVNIHVERVARLPLKSGRELFDSGSVWRLYEDEDGLQFDFSTRFFGERPYKRLIVDCKFRRANLLLRDECFATGDHLAAPLDYPLDEVLMVHRLALEEAIELHGCGIVGPNGANNLFVGHSGAGKSTTARLWTAREDVEVLSDDRIIVRRDDDRLLTESDAESMVGTPFCAVGDADEHEVLRLRDWRSNHFAQDDNAGKWPFGQDDSRSTACSAHGNNKGKSGGEIRMYGTPWHGEAAFASPNSAPLSRILVLEHGRGNVITRLSPSQAVAELFARSFVPFHKHEYVDSALEFLQDLVSVVPCYRYSFEPDHRAVDTVLNFHD